MEELPVTKKEISTYVKKLSSERKFEEKEKFLLRKLEEGDRSTIIIGSLINLYSNQNRNWEVVEELAIEYLTLRPNNGFAQKKLALARKKQGKPKIISDKEKKLKIKEYRRKLYNGEIKVEQLEEILTGCTEFEKKMLEAEFYSSQNMLQKARQTLKETAELENLSEKERKFIKQALQIVKANKMNEVKKRIGWRALVSDGEWQEH